MEGAVNLRPGLFVAALAAVGVWFAPFEEGLGSGFQLRENSASSLGNAFAGAAASAEDPSIIANNPAGMTELSGNQVSGDISIVVPSGVFSGMGLTVARQPISGGNGGDAGSAQPVPAAYGLYDASPDLKFGLAISAPFGLTTQYDIGWVGRYQAIKSDIETININPNIAYRVLEWLSIGGGPAIQHAHTEFTNAINATTLVHLASPLLPAGLTLPDGSARVTGNSLSVGYTLGLLAEVSPGTRFGASYRSQISHRVEGSALSTFQLRWRPAQCSRIPRLAPTSKAPMSSAWPDLARSRRRLRCWRKFSGPTGALSRTCESSDPTAPL
jgi:long-chain fatty acid transport protein